MKVLLYDYCQLEERSAKQLKIWKGWHVTLFVVAAICGILNYVFLQSASQLVDGHCVLYPSQLAFHMVSLPDLPPQKQHDTSTESPATDRNSRTELTTTEAAEPNSRTDVTLTEATSEININTESNTAQVDRNKNGVKVKREARSQTEITMEEKNASFVTGNFSDRLMLDTTRTIFGKMTDCQFAEYMPLLSTVFAVVWTAIFVICPKGGLVLSSSSLQHPWRVLVPALVFSLVLVGLTGHSFTRTNGGLHAFCEAFREHTNSTTCSSVDPFLERSLNTSWGLGGRAAAARAASAGAWASWACAAAVLLARCLAAPDFQLRRTGVYLNDPRKSMRVQPKSPVSSRHNTASLRSEPTYSTELIHQSDVHPQKHSNSPHHDSQAQPHQHTDIIGVERDLV